MYLMCTHDQGENAEKMIKNMVQKELVSQFRQKTPRQLRISKRKIQEIVPDNFLSTFRKSEALNYIEELEDQDGFQNESNQTSQEESKIERREAEYNQNFAHQNQSIQNNPEFKMEQIVKLETLIKQNEKEQQSHIVSRQNFLNTRMHNFNLSSNQTIFKSKTQTSINIRHQAYPQKKYKYRSRLSDSRKNTLNNVKMDKDQMHKYILRRLEEEQKLSKHQLQNHIFQYHPQDKFKDMCKIDICIDDFLELESKAEIPQMLKDIGVGPSMYLLVIRGLRNLFFMLTLINLPIMYIYASGDGTSRISWSSEKIFGMFSNGNLGQDYLAVNYHLVNSMSDENDQFEQSFQEQNQFHLHCNQGNLFQITSIGLTQDPNYYKYEVEIHNTKARISPNGDATVSEGSWTPSEIKNEQIDKLTNHYLPYDKVCSTFLSVEFRESDFVKDIIKQFDENCTNKDHCDVELILSYLQGTDCFKNLVESMVHDMIRTQENKFLKFHIVTLCKTERKIKLLLADDMYIQREQIHTVAIYTQLLSICVFIVYMSYLNQIQYEFAIKFDCQSVELRDFTIKIYKLPEKYKDYTDEISIKYNLWKQIQEKLKDCQEQGICSNNVDTTIVEINFGLNSYKNLNTLQKISELNNLIEYQNIKHSKDTEKMKNYWKLQIMKTQKQLKKLTEKCVQGHKHDNMFSDDVCHQKDQTRNCFGRYSCKNQDRQTLWDRIIVVYITMKSMEAKNLLQHYVFSEDGRYLQKLRTVQSQKEEKNRAEQEPINIEMKDLENQNYDTNGQVGKEKIVENMKSAIKSYAAIQHEKESKRINEQIQCVPVIDPEFILWENFGILPDKKLRQKIFSYLVLILIVGFTFCLVTILSRLRSKLSNNYDYNLCKKKVDYISVVENQNLNQKQFNQIIQCYCSQKFKSHTLDFFQLDEQKCQKWFQTQSLLWVLQLGLPIAITGINIVSEIILTQMAKYERELNTGMQNILVFKYIFIQSFINTGIILVFFKDSNDSQNWQINVGPQICLTLICEIIGFLAVKSFDMILKNLQKWYDRKSDHELNTEHKDLPNTKQVRQIDLQQLYTGPQIQIAQQFAKMFMFIFISLIYSTAIPMVYMITFGYFHLLYLFESIFLVKHHSFTKVFSEELPQISMGLIKYVVILNLMSTCGTLFLANFYHLPTLNKTHLDGVIMEVQRHEAFFNSFHGFSPICFMILLVISYIWTTKQKRKNKKLILGGEKINLRQNPIISVLKNIHKLKVKAWKQIKPTPKSNESKYNNNKKKGLQFHDVIERTVMLRYVEDLKKNKSLQDKMSSSNFFEGWSSNFYNEINFEYLEMYYENILIHIYNCEQYKKKILKHFNKNKCAISIQEAQNFQNYLDDTNQTKSKIQETIDSYYAKILQNRDSLSENEGEKSVCNSLNQQVLIHRNDTRVEPEFLRGNYFEGGEDNKSESKEQGSERSRDISNDQIDIQLSQFSKNRSCQQTQSNKKQRQNFRIQNQTHLSYSHTGRLNQQSNINKTNPEFSENENAFVSKSSTPRSSDQVKDTNQKCQYNHYVYSIEKIDQKNEEIDYLDKLKHLNQDETDEQEIKQKNKSYIRCNSIVQSFNIQCCPDYYKLDEALQIGKFYVENPVLQF